MDSSDIAVVVPVFGDAAAAEALIRRIGAWPDQPRELVVVSADSDAHLRALCEARDCRYLQSEPNRGAQLDRGARTCTSPVLWFLHADAVPSPASMGAIVSHLATGAEGGYFRFQFLGEPSYRKRFLQTLVNLRVELGGIPYGDQGLFVRRDAYLECGGFAHQPLFEEVSLVRTLRARGHFRGLKMSIAVATRRWERDGWWRRSLANRRLALCYLLGAPAERLAADYERQSRTEGEPG